MLVKFEFLDLEFLVAMEMPGDRKIGFKVPINIRKEQVLMFCSSVREFLRFGSSQDGIPAARNLSQQ